MRGRALRSKDALSSSWPDLFRPSTSYLLLRNKPWMPATSAGMTPSNERIVQINPFRIGRVDKTNLPGARPMLNRLFPLNCVSNIFKALCVDQSLQAVTFGKSINKPFPMFEGSSRQIARNASSIQYAVAPIGHEINPATRH